MHTEQALVLRFTNDDWYASVNFLFCGDTYSQQTTVIWGRTIIFIHSAQNAKETACTNYTYIHQHLAGAYSLSLSKAPSLAAHRAVLLDILLGLQPLHDTLHMKCVSAFTPNWRTVVSRILHIWAACFVWHPADTAHLKFCNSNVSQVEGDIQSQWSKCLTSSSISHFQIATPCHLLIRTFISGHKLPLWTTLLSRPLLVIFW